MTPMKWFYSFLKKYSGLICLGLVMTTAIAALSIVNPYISGVIVDEVIQAGNYDLLPVLIASLLGVTLVTGILRFLYQVVFETASQGVLYDMRDKVYRKLLNEDFAFYNKKRTGDLMSRQTGDMDAVRHFVAFVIYVVYQYILQFIFALLMIFSVNTKLALLMILVLPLTALNTYKQSKEIRPAFQRNRNCFSSLNAFVQENVSGNRVVKAFAKEDYEIEKFNKENDKFRDSQIKASRVWMKYVPKFEILSYALTIILMSYGSYMVIRGEITLFDDVTMIHYQNPVRILYRRDSVGDNKYGAVFFGLDIFQLLLDVAFSLHIYSRGGIVQYQDSRVFQQGSGKRNTLFLTTGKSHTTFAYNSLIAIRHVLDKVIGICHDGCLPDFLEGAVGSAISNVALNGIREQEHILHSHTDVIPQVIQVMPADIDPVHQNLAGSSIVEAAQQVHQCGFT